MSTDRDLAAKVAELDSLGSNPKLSTDEFSHIVDSELSPQFERTCMDCGEKYVSADMPMIPRCPPCKKEATR